LGNISFTFDMFNVSNYEHILILLILKFTSFFIFALLDQKNRLSHQCTTLKSSSSLWSFYIFMTIQSIALNRLKFTLNSFMKHMHIESPPKILNVYFRFINYLKKKFQGKESSRRWKVTSFIARYSYFVSFSAIKDRKVWRED